MEGKHCLDLPIAKNIDLMFVILECFVVPSGVLSYMTYCIVYCRAVANETGSFFFLINGKYFIYTHYCPARVVDEVKFLTFHISQT